MFRVLGPSVFQGLEVQGWVYDQVSGQGPLSVGFGGVLATSEKPQASNQSLNVSETFQGSKASETLKA